MPTPSSDQPSDSPPPQSQSHGFPTCPEELQSPANEGREDDTNLESDRSHGMHSSETGAQSPVSMGFVESIRTGSVDHSLPRVRDSILASEGRTSESLDPSSRATTMSPPPQSTATARTSPASELVVDEVNKRAQVDSDVTLSRASTEQSRMCFDLSGRRSPDQPRNVGVDVGSASLDGELYAPSMGSHFPSTRTTSVSPSSYLRPGSKFQGTQQSERQVYEVQVEIKHIDMRESFLCGYLRIQGLTEDHPTLTTYFEGEIIGSKYNFFTNHESWGATRKTDLKHWKRFSAFHPFKKQVEKGPASVSNVSERENIFMRWKEHFLVPDHRVRTITGASFEGFYYICFNQIKGEVSGIYFHSKSEKFQELELKHVPDRGCFSAVEFR